MYNMVPDLDYGKEFGKSVSRGLFPVFFMPGAGVGRRDAFCLPRLQSAGSKCGLLRSHSDADRFGWHRGVCACLVALSRHGREVTLSHATLSLST